MRIIVKLAINTFSLLIVEYIIPGFQIKDIWTALVSAVVIGVINTFIKPILQIIALPISIITLGVSAFLLRKKPFDLRS